VEDVDGDFGIALREPGEAPGHGVSGGGGGARGEQPDEPVGARGNGRERAAVGAREGREWESGGGGGGDVRGGAGEREHYGREPDDQPERRGDGGELDAERHGGPEHADGYLRVARREPGDVHRDRDGGPRGYAGEELGGQPHRASGHTAPDAARRGRERRQRQPGGGRDGHVGGGVGRRVGRSDHRDHRRERACADVPHARS